MASSAPIMAVGVTLVFIWQNDVHLGSCEPDLVLAPEQIGDPPSRLVSDPRVENGLRVSWGVLTLFAMVITR